MPSSRRAESDPIHGRRFAYIAAGLCFLIALLPYLYGKLLEPVGQSYLGYQYNTDDHMVYSAWMRQAMDGRFFFDNRFAVDAQPGLTVHLYFFVLGLIAKVIGLAFAANLAKAIFAAVFVLLLYRLLSEISANAFFIKLSLSVAVVGGGIGFLVWHRFGEAMVLSDYGGLGSLLHGRLPIDVWQPEAFVFPSMLTNGLFMVSLCLIVGFFVCVLRARESFAAVPCGFIILALLMNIHSYDVLLTVLVLVAFLAASAASKTLTGAWLGRVALMGLGAVGPALWFWHVYQNDPVFQARAATDTFSPAFPQVIGGLLFMVGVGIVGLLRGVEGDCRLRHRVGAAAFGVGVILLLALSGNAGSGYWMGWPAWIASFAAVLVLVGLLSRPEPAWNLVLSWALAGLIAIYFPALFQRKLAMGMAVPWAILASIGLWQVTNQVDRGMRNLVAALAIIVLSASSIRWFLREGEFIRGDVSRTTVHPVFLTNDAVRILDYLNRADGRNVVLAMPGIAMPTSENGEPQPDRFDTPYLPDLNPIASGLTGVYTYAGHWSETPNYLERRNRATAFFLKVMSDDARRQLIREIGVTYIIAPVPEAFENLYALAKVELADLTELGTTVVEGSQFRLIKVVD